MELNGTCTKGHIRHGVVTLDVVTTADVQKGAGRLASLLPREPIPLQAPIAPGADVLDPVRVR